ncbi:MAG: hypothetical protein ACP5QR_08230 [Rhizomicrobium sp.]
MERTKATTSLPTELGDDLLRGAEEIATFIFGERGSRRKIYYLAETSHLPVFRLGSTLCARRRASVCSPALDRRARKPRTVFPRTVGNEWLARRRVSRHRFRRD